MTSDFENTRGKDNGKSFGRPNTEKKEFFLKNEHQYDTLTCDVHSPPSTHAHMGMLGTRVAYYLLLICGSNT